MKQELPSRVVASDNGIPSVARMKRRGRRKKKRRNRILPKKTSTQKRKNSNIAGKDASQLKLQLRIQKQLQQKLKERRKKARILKRKRAQAKENIKRKKLAKKKQQKEKQRALLLKRKRQKARKAARKKARLLRRKKKLRNKKKTKTKVKPKKSKKLSTSDQTLNAGSQIDLTNSLDLSGPVLIDPSQMRSTVFEDNWTPSLAEFQPPTQENILDQNNFATSQHFGRNISLDQNLISAPFQKTVVQKNINVSEDGVQIQPHGVLHDNASNTTNEHNDGQTDNPAMGHSTVSPLSDLNSVLPLDTLNETFHEIPEQPIRVVSFQDVNIGSDGTIIFLNEQNISSQSVQQNTLDTNIHNSSSPIATHPAMGETLVNNPKLSGDSLNSQLSPVAPPERQAPSGDSYFDSLFKDIWVQLNDAGI